MSRIAWKNHHNGARNPRAQFRKEVSMETIAKSPLVAGDLGVFDCSRGEPTARPPPSSAGPRTPTGTPTTRST